MPDPSHEEQWIQENFGRVWPAHLSAFTHLLVALRKHFDGDLDLLLVLAVIGKRTRPQHWTPSLDSTQRLTADDSSGKQHPINGLSIANCSGVPRETVRRKLAVLEKKGWISANEEGHWIASAKAAEDLNQATSDTVSYLSTILRTIRMIDAAGTEVDETISE